MTPIIIPPEGGLLPGAIENTPPAPVKTLWDDYAMAALTGLLANPSLALTKPTSWVADAGRCADAMMTERKRRESNNDQ